MQVSDKYRHVDRENAKIAPDASEYDCGRQRKTEKEDRHVHWELRKIVVERNTKDGAVKNEAFESQEVARLFFKRRHIRVAADCGMPRGLYTTFCT